MVPEEIATLSSHGPWKKHEEVIMPLLLLLLLLSHFSRVRLCDPRDGSPPGSPIPGILPAGTLDWVAISFSNSKHQISFDEPYLKSSKQILLKLYWVHTQPALCFEITLIMKRRKKLAYSQQSSRGKNAVFSDLKQILDKWQRIQILWTQKAFFREYCTIFSKNMQKTM